MLLHLTLHVAVPAAVARAICGVHWRRTWCVMMATMVVDVDHLLANPIFDPNRCSIGFHPLHTTPAIAVYAVATMIPATRWIGVGLLIHMSLDLLDCLAMGWCG